MRQPRKPLAPQGTESGSEMSRHECRDGRHECLRHVADTRFSCISVGPRAHWDRHECLRHIPIRDGICEMVYFAASCSCPTAPMRDSLTGGFCGLPISEGARVHVPLNSVAEEAGAVIRERQHATRLPALPGSCG